MVNQNGLAPEFPFRHGYLRHKFTRFCEAELSKVPRIHPKKVPDTFNSGP